MAAFFQVDGLGTVTTDPDLVEGGKVFLENNDYFVIPNVGVYRVVMSAPVDLLNNGHPVSLGVSYAQVSRTPDGVKLIQARLYDPDTGNVRNR